MGRDDARDKDRRSPVAVGSDGVGAGVKELNEMTIGRTDDPENPISVPAFEAAKLFGTGSRTPSGPADMAPRQQAGHMLATDQPVSILLQTLASNGPFSNRVPPVNSLLLVLRRFERSFRQPTQVRTDTSFTTGHSGASTASPAASRH
jgi:hypothetical protein